MMKRASRARHTLSAAHLLALCASHAPARAQEAARRPTPRRASVRLVTQETSLGKRHAGEIEDTRTVSHDGKRIAFVVKAANGEAVAVDGVVGKAYPYVTRDPFNESGISQPITFSPDAQRVAYVAARNTAHRAPRVVVVDGKEGAPFDYIWTGAPRFSQDGRRFAYNGQRGGKWHVVVDGLESKPFDGAGAVMFSKDGSRAAFEAKRGGQNLFVVDGVEFAADDPEGQLRFYGEAPREPREVAEGDKRVVVWEEFNSKPYDEVRDLTLTEASGGRILTFAARLGDRWHVVIDGKESKPYEHVSNVKVNPKDGRVLFTAREGEKWFVVVDGKEGKSSDSVDGFSARFSPDGKHFAYEAVRESEESRKVLVITDGAEGKEYDLIDGLAYTHDGRLVYLAYRLDVRKTFFVRDGEEVASYDGTPFAGIRFSPDGKRTFFRVERPGGEMLVIDGTPYSYDEIKNVEFSPDGSRFIFKARKGSGWMMVVDGAESEAYEPEGARGKVEWSERDAIAFSRDGSRTAYVARKGGKNFVVADGFSGKHYDDIQNLGFTADGRHVVYTARRGAKFVVVVDGVESKEYDRFVARSGHEQDFKLDIAADGSLSILAERGQERLRVRIEIVEE